MNRSRRRNFWRIVAFLLASSSIFPLLAVTANHPLFGRSVFRYSAVALYAAATFVYGKILERRRDAERTDIERENANVRTKSEDLAALADKSDDHSGLLGMNSSRTFVPHPNKVVGSSSKIEEIERRVSEFIERLDSVSISEVQVAFRSSEEIDAILREFEKIAHVAAELMKRDLEDAYSNSISPETVSDIWAAFSRRLRQGPIRRR